MSAPLSRFRYYRLVLLVSLAIILPLGYWVRFSHGPLPEWLNDALGSVAYEIFWILLVLLCFPQLSPWWVALGVCLATCGIEFLQLWKPPFLQAARATLPGRLVLGNTFNVSDFPAYWVGSGLGGVWGRSLQTRAERSRKF
ncbi:MAG: DUF2809 domain-containing protein [Scytolyngbya sp. HA4215-MV1]|jgi:hypothetical protein|nr:DUF2809 domain-containing protein [Scytolyngbya sp. HA4215-MV1]